jgi:nitrogen regulatory protein PII
MMNRPTRSMTGIEKCIQVKKANEMKEELSEAILEAMTMVKTKEAMGYGKKK